MARRGELSLLVGLVASALVAALAGSYPPLEPLAALIMEWTPVPIANALLDLLGPVGKPLALYGAAAIALALAGPLSLLAARGPFGRLNRPLALTLLLLSAWTLARPGALPGLATLVLVTGATYTWLERRAAGHPAHRRRDHDGSVVNNPVILSAAKDLRTNETGKQWCWSVRRSFATLRMTRFDGRGRDARVAVAKTLEPAAVPAGSAAPEPATLPPGDTAPSRRRFLVRAAANTVALAAVSLLPVAASSVRTVLVGRTPRPTLFPFSSPPPRAAGFALAGLTPEVTSVPDFYRMSKNVADPVLDETVWSLAVSGRVGRALSLTLDDLAELPRVERWVTMQCVSNPVGGPLWSAALFSGVSLADLIRRADPLPDAAWVSFEAPDGHREQLPLEQALDPLVLVAYGMNGDWLTPEHGFPARLLATGLYGFRSVKWLTRVELLDRPRAGHWEERGWTAADIHTTARVDLVRPDGDGLLAAGVAFAGRRGVSRVEARVNGGPWQVAELHVPPLSEAMWVQWRTRLPLTSGPATIEARAIDARGAPQDETARGQFPSGATGLHGLTVRL